jgi:ABC-type amino acid transport system permease subunit
MLDALASLETPTVFHVGVIAAVFVEALTVLLRFGLGWTSPEKTGGIARFTRGWRVHHLYPGIALVLIALLVPMPPALRNLAWMSGIMLALSDALHHFAILWPFTGDHEFDLRYPGFADDAVEDR